MIKNNRRPPFALTRVLFAAGLAFLAGGTWAQTPIRVIPGATPALAPAVSVSVLVGAVGLPAPSAAMLPSFLTPSSHLVPALPGYAAPMPRATPPGVRLDPTIMPLAVPRAAKDAHLDNAKSVAGLAFDGSGMPEAAPVNVRERASGLTLDSYPAGPARREVTGRDHKAADKLYARVMNERLYVGLILKAAPRVHIELIVYDRKDEAAAMKMLTRRFGRYYWEGIPVLIARYPPFMSL